MWRGETMGSFFLVFNAIMNYDHLNAGRPTQPPANTTVAGEGEED